MATTYKLIAFSRDVGKISLGFNKHSGYGLVKYEDGQAVAMKTAEVSGTSVFGYVDFIMSNDEACGYADGWIPVTEINGQVIPEKVFEDGAWINTTSEWLASREYKTVVLQDEAGNVLNNAEALFNKIQNNAEYLDMAKISYDAANQNCNTWVGYIDRTILENVGVFNQLNSIGEVNTYIGNHSLFPVPGIDAYILVTATEGWHEYFRDKAIIENAEKVQAYLDTENLNPNNIDIVNYCNPYMACCVVNYNGTEVIFTTPYEQTKKNITPLINKIQSVVTSGEGTASPLVVDLDGDGVETKEENSQIYFDHDGNGFAESSGWVGQDDGLLVRDINGNGQIDDGTELFGNNSVLSNGQSAANDNDILFSSKAL